MKHFALVLTAIFLSACTTHTYDQPPVRLGSHFQFFPPEKRGICFGSADPTPISPELNQWLSTGGPSENGALVAWSRDILSGSGCDEHRFSVIQGKMEFDIRSIPRSAAIAEAYLKFTIREVPSAPVAGPVIRRLGGGEAVGRIDGLDPRNCFDGGRYFAEYGAARMWAPENLAAGLSGGEMLSYDFARMLPDPGDARLTEPRVYANINVLDVLRRYVQQREASINFIVSPRNRLDPPDPGSVTPQGFDWMYCAAYIKSVSLHVTYHTR